MKFRAKSENELSRLSDDDLVAYLVAARDAGQDDQAVLATSMLALRRQDVLVALTRLKVASPHDVEDIVCETIADTIRAAFRGEYAGEFFSMMRTIHGRRIADYYERRNREGRPVGPDADGNNPVDDVAAPDQIEPSITADLLDRLLEPYSPRDRMVIERKLDGYRSKEIAAQVDESGIDGGEGMTQANVDQIFSRFRKDIRSESGLGGVS